MNSLEDNDKDKTVPQEATNNVKRWMSEPTLLGDFDDDWIKRSSQVSEDSVSFSDEVVQSNLTHVTKQRVQFRPKRRPPSRDFIKSRASIDFEFAVPEKITEVDEDETENSDEKKDDNVLGETTGPAEETGATSSPPEVASKPRDMNAWRLPTLEQELVLRKTHSIESKRSEIIKQDSIPKTSSETSDDSVDLQHCVSPDKRKKRRRRPRIKLKLFKRRSSHDAETRTSTEQQFQETRTTDPNMNLRKCKSVDTGSRALGEDHTRSWLHKRWRRKSNEKRNLNWLLGLFHKNQSDQGSGKTSPTTSQATSQATSPTTSPIKSQTTSQTTSRAGDEETSINGDVKSGHDLVNGEEENDKHETVSDLRKKFEYMV